MAGIEIWRLKPRESTTHVSALYDGAGAQAFDHFTRIGVRDPTDGLVFPTARMSERREKQGGECDGRKGS